MLFVFNLNAVLLTLTVLLIPFAVLPIFLSLERIPQALRHASADLGASSAQTFWRITLPLSLPGAVSATSFVFVLAIGDFLTPQMVGGQSGFTFGRIVYSQFGTAFNWPFGAALSVILVAVVVARHWHWWTLRPAKRDLLMRVADRASTALLIALTILVFILLYGPLMVPIISSFFTINRGAVDWSQPTISAYAALASERERARRSSHHPDRRRLRRSPIARDRNGPRALLCLTRVPKAGSFCSL